MVRYFGAEPFWDIFPTLHEVLLFDVQGDDLCALSFIMDPEQGPHCFGIALHTRRKKPYFLTNRNHSAEAFQEFNCLFYQIAISLLGGIIFASTLPLFRSPHYNKRLFLHLYQVRHVVLQSWYLQVSISQYS